jgi:hypothetical protein
MGEPSAVPTYVTEFFRWRDASAEDRETIARQQSATPIESFVPDLQAYKDRISEMPMPCGKAGADCTPADFAEMKGWYLAILKARCAKPALDPGFAARLAMARCTI